MVLLIRDSKTLVLLGKFKTKVVNYRHTEPVMKWRNYAVNGLWTVRELFTDLLTRIGFYQRVKGQKDFTNGNQRGNPPFYLRAIPLILQ